jgi:ubiquinol-cytochrome c reductase cytochrome c1 subunit
MMRIFLIIIVLLLPLNVAAEELTVELEHAPIHVSDMESVKRGAKFFSTTCMACHTLIYLRYNKLAHDAGVIYERMPINVKQWPQGVKPPDLSLEASYRGVDWIYTYLHSFYLDPSRPSGFNNLVLPNTAMTAILAPYQGKQVKATDIKQSSGAFNRGHQWYDDLVLQQQGTMSPEQFDTLVTDIVNFLNYAANPYQSWQEKIGVWVIGFFIIMFVLMFWLKHEFWKDVEKNKKN